MKKQPIRIMISPNMNSNASVYGMSDELFIAHPWSNGRPQLRLKMMEVIKGVKELIRMQKYQS